MHSPHVSGMYHVKSTLDMSSTNTFNLRHYHSYYFSYYYYYCCFFYCYFYYYYY